MPIYAYKCPVCFIEFEKLKQENEILKCNIKQLENELS